MHVRLVCRSLGLVSLVLCLVPDRTSGASFQGLGDVAGGSFYSNALGISGDGTTVVGQSSSSSSSSPAFVWTAAGGIKPLYNTTITGLGNKVSANGSLVAGEDDSFGARAVRYTVSGGTLTYLGGLNPNGNPPNQGRAYSLSRDGSVLVGSVASPASTAGEQAFRYTGGTLTPLGFLGSTNGTSFNSEAHDVSGDGSVTVGFSSSSAGQEAFRYTTAGGMQDLGRLAGDTTSRYIANAVSTDGTVIVGSAIGNKAFIWTQATGMLALAGLSSAANPLDVSADGSVIVGSDKLATDLNAHAVFWQNGVELNLKTFLMNQGNTAVTNWDLRSATGISEDGFTICGTGIDPSGFTEAFIANIRVVPEPSTWALVGLGGAGLLGLTLRQRLCVCCA